MSGTALDDLDRKILQALQLDGRLTNVELAEKVGLSPSPCLARARRLEKEGVISHYVALLDSERLGPIVSVFIQITLSQQSESVLEVFEKRVKSMPEVMECYLRLIVAQLGDTQAKVPANRGETGAMASQQTA